LVDPGADDTILPIDAAAYLAVPLLPHTGHALRWQGQRHLLHFGVVELELIDDAGSALRWPAIVGFSPINMRYPLLGIGGCLEFLDAKFCGKDRVVELEPNASLPVIN
jgi:hypothetical protein